MAEETGASDSSWKKLVIAKNNDEWVSNVKDEKVPAEQTMNILNYKLSEEQVSFVEVKIESTEESLNYHDESESSDATSSGFDPLLRDDSTPKRRRKNSGPHTETPEARSARLARMSAYASKRLANETPEQRSARLKRMSHYAAKRLAEETVEQRAKRLSRMSAYAARRLAEETLEQRLARLRRMSAYAAKRQYIKKYGADASKWVGGDSLQAQKATITYSKNKNL